MMTMTALWTIVVITLALSVLMATIETAGGFIGDSSLVPGILACGGVVCIITMVIGLVTGNWNMTFN